MFGPRFHLQYGCHGRGFNDVCVCVCVWGFRFSVLLLLLLRPVTGSKLKEHTHPHPHSASEKESAASPFGVSFAISFARTHSAPFAGRLVSLLWLLSFLFRSALYFSAALSSAVLCCSGSSVRYVRLCWYARRRCHSLSPSRLRRFPLAVGYNSRKFFSIESRLQHSQQWLSHCQYLWLWLWLCLCLCLWLPSHNHMCMCMCPLVFLVY